MLKDIFTLATQFQKNLQPLVKTAAKEKVNRGRLGKKLDKATSEYQKLKHELDVLEADDVKLKERLEATRSGAQKARKNIMHLHSTRKNMDLSSANDAVFYADDADVGYIVNGKEFHIEVDDAGEVQLVPMGQHRKDKKSKKDEPCKDDGCADDTHSHFAPGSKDVEMDDDSGEEQPLDGAEDFDKLYSSLME